MRYGQALNVIDKSGLSPEKAALELGVSGMTLRRWRKKSPEEALPDLYRLALVPLTRRLIGEGVLHPQDPDAAAVFAQPDEPFQKALREAGITAEALLVPAKRRDSVVRGLAEIGHSEKRQRQVRESSGMLAEFQTLGKEWTQRISDLTQAMVSKEITALDKLVAFGALFYLITPFDLIPDAIPAIGLSDDFAVLGIAALYYRSRFPSLFQGRPGQDSKKP